MSPPRWVVSSHPDGAVAALFVALAWAAAAGLFVERGAHGSVGRAVLVAVAATLLWCLAFIRRFTR